MKCCERCGDEIATRDGENLCKACDASQDHNVKRLSRTAAAKRRRERDAVMESLGLVKVRGAMGGTYWE